MVFSPPLTAATPSPPRPEPRIRRSLQVPLQQIAAVMQFVLPQQIAEGMQFVLPQQIAEGMQSAGDPVFHPNRLLKRYNLSGAPVASAITKRCQPT